MATKRLYCRCDAIARYPRVRNVWGLAEQQGAMSIGEICEKCGYVQWSFPSPLAVKRWYASISRTLACPQGGYPKNDCEGCAYSGDYHFENGDCVRR